MATITATKNGNWSDTSVWDLARVPADGDAVALAGYDIVWDNSITRIPSSGTLLSISSTGTDGQITIDLSDAAFHGGASLFVTTMTAGTKPATQGMLWVSGTTDHILTITTGNSPNGIIGGSNTLASCVYNSGSGTINITGDVTGASGAYSYGVANYGTGALNITGNVYGGTSGSQACGVRNNSSGAISVSGNITGGTGDSDWGFHNMNGAVSIGGNVIGGTGNIAHGFYNNGTGNVTLSSTSKLIQGSGAAAYTGKAPAWQPDSTSYVKMYVGASFGQAANTEFPQVLAAGNIKAGVVSGSVTGTLASGGTLIGKGSLVG